MVSPLEHDYIGLASSSSSNEEEVELGDLKGTELRLGMPGSESPGRKNAVRLNLGKPRSSVSRAKRGFLDTVKGPGSWGFAGGGGSRGEFGKGGEPAGDDKKTEVSSSAPAAKAQVVGWPPIRSFRRNTMAANPSKNKDDAAFGCLFVKVSMDGAPYLRKVDLKTYCNYKDLSLALEKMFSCFSIGQCTSQGMPGKDELSQSRLVDLHGSEYVLTYEDKDGDWMLVGDVPWDMFTNSCRRLRIMRGSEAIGLGSAFNWIPVNLPAAPRPIEMQASERH